MHSNMRIQTDTFSKKIGIPKEQESYSIASKNVGDIMTGTIVQSADGHLGVRTEKDEMVQLPDNKSDDYKVGEAVELKVTKKTRDRIEIQMRKLSENVSKAPSSGSLSQSIDMNKVRESIVTSDNPLRYVENIDNMITQTSQRIEEMMNGLTDTELGLLVESGYDLTRMTMDTLYQVGHSGKVDKKIALEGDDTYTLAITVDEEKIQSAIEQTIETLPMNHMDTKRLQEIVETLQDKDMAVTLRSVEKMNHMLEKTDQIRQMSTQDQLRFLSSNKIGTLGELYKSIYISNGSMPKQVMSESDYADIASDVEEIVNRYADEHHIEVHVDELISKSKEALMHGIPVDERTLDLFALGTEGSVSDQELMESAIQKMEKGESISQVKLLNEEKVQMLSHEDVQKVVDIVQEADNNDVEAVLKDNKHLSIKNLQEAKGYTDSKDGNEQKKVDRSMVDSAIKDLDVLRYQMTFKTAMRLNIQGMDLQNEQLSTIRHRIEELEASDMMVSGDINTEESGQEAEVDSAKAQWLALRRNIAVVNGASTESIGKAALEEEEVSLEQLAGKVQKGADRYDALRTMPRKDLGDRVEKAFRNVDDILDDLGLEQNLYNRRAVEILGRNQMSVTVDTIEQVKALDVQLQTLINNLDPSVVKKLVEAGENLLDMPLDKLVQQVQALDEGMKEKASTSLSKRIQKVMNMETITKETKEAVIGTYRLIHTIQSNKGAAVGFLMKNNMQPTLEHLFDASKYMRQQQISANEGAVVNHVVDDELGLLERVEQSALSIKEQITQGIFDKKMSLDNFLNQLESGNNEGLSREAQQVMKEARTLVIQDSVQELRHALEVLSKSQDVKSMMKNYPELELTIEGWEGLSKMVKDGQWLKNTLNSVVGDRNISAEIKENIKEAVNQVFEKPSDESYEQLSKALTRVQEEALEGSYSKDAKTTIQTEDVAKLSKTLETQLQVQKALDNHMPTAIPIWINGEMQQMNMFYQRRQTKDNDATNQAMSIYMSFTTKHMGVTNIRVDFAEENTDVTMYATTTHGQEQLKENEVAIKKVLEGMSMPVDHIRFERFDMPAVGDVDTSKRQQNHIKKYQASKFEHVV